MNPSPIETNLDWHFQLLSKHQVTFDDWIIIVRQQQGYIPILEPTNHKQHSTKKALPTTATGITSPVTKSCTACSMHQLHT